nr:uncharacterized protein LOC113702010 [Coffea arabica]
MVRGHEVDNRWVVPYSPYLLVKFNCHLNVEICSTVKAVKYMYKYIYKGHDKIHFQLNSQNSNELNFDGHVSAIDEIKDYQSARWVCAVEVFVEKKGAFFIDGPGGMRKTFLYRALLAEIKSKEYIALVIASCGVAASILPEPLISKNSIQIPVSMLIRYTNEKESMNTLIRTVFPDLNAFCQDNFSAINRAILTAKNDFVDQINQGFIVQLEGQLQEYISRDKCIDSSKQTIMEDLLNSLTPNGFPPHKLLLKPYCPIMLLRNIDPPQGLCNGTRLICKSLSSNIIHAVITCGEFAEKEVFIHKICFRAQNNSDSPVLFERIQFPVRPCFAMTINKAQGQTLDFVGIYLRESIFSRGQLYVAISRVKNSSSIKILIKPLIFDDQEDSITENIVYTEVLDLAYQ